MYKSNGESHQQNQEISKSYIKKEQLQLSEEMIVLKSPIQLKCISAGVTGAGMGWYQNLVNRHVDKSYNCDDYKQDMAQFLKERGFNPSHTVGMMTAVELQYVAYEERKGHEFSLFIVVTAGIGNAVDAAFGKMHYSPAPPGTINSWIFVNGKLTDEAFIQGVVTDTEAKTKALREAKVMDAKTGTLATGTSTDSILIAATQQGRELEFGGSISELGALIGEAVYSCTTKALRNTREK